MARISPFDDPFYAGGSDEERLAEFRRVRDEIRARIEAGLLKNENCEDHQQ